MNRLRVIGKYLVLLMVFVFVLSVIVGWESRPATGGGKQVDLGRTRHFGDNQALLVEYAGPVLLDYPAMVPFGHGDTAFTSNSILVQQRKAVFEFSFNGRIATRYEAPYGFIINNFSYLPSEDLVVMVLSEYTRLENRLVVAHKRGLSDASVALCRVNLSRETGYFRQLQECGGGRFVANLWSDPAVAPGLSPSTLLYMLEVKIEPTEGVFAFQGDFSTGTLTYPHLALKMGYAVLVDNDLFTVSEEGRRLAWYRLGEGGRRILDERPLTLSNWSHALMKRPSADGGSATDTLKKELLLWAHSYSKVVGLWRDGDRLLIGYVVPNHAFYDEVRQGKTSKLPMFHSRIDRLNSKSAELLDESPESYICGVRDGRVASLRWEDRSVRLEIKTL